MALIRLENVEVSYGDQQALRGVTLNVEGGAVGLLGLNGAGKSTLLKTLLGFLRAKQGCVAVFGKEVPRHALAVRQRLGYMPERDVVSPKISAVSFLTYCGRLFGMSRVDAMERAHEVLNYVGVGSSRYRKIETYSTGMRQRIKFGQALIHDPKLLLLDEPTTGLDPNGRLEMLRLIHELAVSRGVAVLLSSHVLPDVEHVCDRVVMMHEGRIIQDGSVRDLMANCEGMIELRVRDNEGAYLVRIEEAGFAWRRQPNGALLVTRPGGGDTRALFEIARAQRTQVRHFLAVRRSLEEVFMHAVGRS